MLELMILVQSICLGFIAGSWEHEFQRPASARAHQERFEREDSAASCFR
jgi:hypothetical protein